jgi:Protein of unknown function (DUF559)
MSPGRELPEVADEQLGVFTRRQAYDEGWTPRQVRRRLVAGRWRVLAGVALCGPRQEVGAWQLAFAVRLTWPRAVISHQVAGVLHGFPVAVGPLGTAIVDRDVSAHSPGLLSHRCLLPPEDVGLIGGLPATTEARTAIDLLATSSWSDARDLWAWLATRRRLALDDVRRAADRRHGQHGTPQLRRLVKASAAGSLSAGEDLMHELLLVAGIGGWVANAPVVVDGRVIAVADLLFAASRVIVEVDGWRGHSGRQAFQRDRTRQNALVLAGYLVLRVTWQDLTQRTAKVIRDIEAAIARRP